MTKTKQLLREKVWFPNMDTLVDNTVRDYLSCQLTTPNDTRTPLTMSTLTDGPWLEVSIDFCDLPTGEHLLVVMDDYSRFPEVEIVTSTSARSVIPKLDRILATFGIPKVVRSDNWPPFNSTEFSSFADYLGFHHRKVTQRWPRANGEVERFMKTIKKTYRTAITDRIPWKQALYKFLRNYRATPHATTGVAPATLLFGRPLRTRLPETVHKSRAKPVRLRDKCKKAEMKQYADNREHARPKNIEIGDTVLLRRDGLVAKHQTPYHTHPYTVTAKKGSMVTAQRGTHTVTRNISRNKHIQTKTPTQQDPEESDIEDMTNPTHTPTRAPAPRQNPARNRHPPTHLWQNLESRHSSIQRSYSAKIDNSVQKV
ncbi:uncharacterized protein K02A2.6-like [Acanthaster planci]|uniref:Uncharacterized protein K02A2.6-like n=1 Tax=Acanthaster planci TaxID=133434 RepID=A0A8B7YUB4_ACAPL|nr:uncharacterized protein K02A2.6-like [Acanthaster planci]